MYKEGDGRTVCVRVRGREVKEEREEGERGVEGGGIEIKRERKRETER